MSGEEGKSGSGVAIAALVVGIAALVVAVFGILIPILLPLRPNQETKIDDSWKAITEVPERSPNWIAVRDAMEYLNRHKRGFLCDKGIVRFAAQLVGTERRCLIPDKRPISFAHCEFKQPPFELQDVELPHADFFDAKLTGADLTDAKLQHANLRVSNLRGAILGGADLTGADLSGAVMVGAYLKDAVLIDADLNGTDLNGATGLTESQLGKACTSGEVPSGVPWTVKECRDDVAGSRPLTAASSSSPGTCGATWQ